MKKIFLTFIILLFSTYSFGADVVSPKSTETNGTVTTVNSEIPDAAGNVIVTTGDIGESTNKKLVRDDDITNLGNLSGENSGDNATNSKYSGLEASKLDINGSNANQDIDIGEHDFQGQNVTATDNASIGGKLEVVGDVSTEGVYSYANLSTPPPLTTQYAQFTYGGDLYFRKAVDNKAASWSYGAYDQTLKFLQLSTAGDDKDNLTDTVTPDIPFSTYWSKVYAGGTISRESDYFKISLPANSGEARLQSFRFDNDVDPYVFDNATCPITFNFDMKFPSTVMGDSFNSLIIASITPIHSYLCKLTFDILRDSAGAASGYKVRVTGISNGFEIVIDNYKINSTVTVPVDTDCVISFYIDGTAWQIFVDGSEIFNSTETGLENDDTTPVSMVLQDDFNLWRNENLRVGIGATAPAGTGTNTVYFKGLTIIPTVINSASITSTDSPYTLTSTITRLLCDTSSGAITVNLEAAVDGNSHLFANADGGTDNLVTFVQYATDEIDGSTDNKTMGVGTLRLTAMDDKGWF